MEERCKQYSFHNLEQVVTVFGCGNGIFAEKLKEAAEPDMRLIIYEPSLEIFDYLMHHTPFAEILIKQNTIVLIQGLNEDKFYGAMDTLLNDNNVNSFQYIVHPGYDRMFPIEYQKYNIEASNGWLRAESNRVTGGYLGKESIYNIVESLPYLKEAQFLEQYVGKFGADIPAVIVAAGPSLDINIETLKKAEGKAVIFAADAAVPRLAEHGIKMDFIVTIDPKKWPGHLAAEACKEVPLICKASANRVIIENHRGKKIFFDMEEYIAALRPEKAGKAKYCGSGGSVATSAFAISVALAFKTVILVGNDLAYRDGCSHAGGVLRREEANAGYRITVESIKGDKIETRYEWYRFLNWFEDIIAHVKEDVKVIDATEGGAKIHGTEIMTLSEAVEQYCTGEIDCRKVTEEIESPYTEDSYKEALEYVEKSLRDLDKIIEESKKTMQKTERLITLCKREQKGKEYQKLEKELFHLGEKIEERPVYGLINEWISKDTENESASMYELDRKEEEMYGDFLQIYKSIHEAAKEIKPILKEAYEKMQA